MSKARIFAAAILSVLIAVFAASCKSDDVYTLEEMLSDEFEAETGGSISMKKLHEYTIVYDDNMTEKEIAAVHGLRDAIAEKTGAFLEVRPSAEKTGDEGVVTDKYEIIVGNAFRPESRYLLKNYWREAGGYGTVGEKLVIIQGMYDASQIGIIEKFTEDVVSGLSPDDEYFFSGEEDGYINRGGIVEELTLNGLPISDYEIVSCHYAELKTSEVNTLIAESFCQRLAEVCGYVLPVTGIDEFDKNGASAEGQIFVGISGVDAGFRELGLSYDNPGEYSVWAAGHRIYVEGDLSYSTQLAVDLMIDKLTPDDGRAVYEVSIGAEKQGGVFERNLTLMRADFADEAFDEQGAESVFYEFHPDVIAVSGTDALINYQFGLTDDSYYSMENLGYAGVYLLYCSDRFGLDEADVIERERDGQKLKCRYAVLCDRYSGEKTVFAAADINDENADMWAEVYDYLTFHGENMIYFGENMSAGAYEALSEAMTEFDGAQTSGDELTMFSSSLAAVSSADCSERLNERSHGSAKAYTVVLSED